MIDRAGERWFVHGLFRDSGVVVGDSFLYVWFFDHIGVFVVVFVFVIVGFHLLRPPDRGDFVRSTVYYGWIGLWCVAG